MHKEKYTEQELVQALKQHDNIAFQYLYMNYRGALYTTILQTLPHEETANDILQETFVQIWKNIDKYDESKGRLFTWMVKLTRNMTINQTRVKNYKVHSKNEEITNYVTSIESKTPEEVAVNHIGLRQQVHKLKQELKEVIELAYFQGYKQEEVSQILQIPLGTVKTRLRNGIIELRKDFK